MSGAEQLYQIIGINLTKLSREEILIFEAQFFTLLCIELKECFKLQQKEYFFLIKRSEEMEKIMENNFVSLVVKDIIATGEYTQQGIAYYSQVPEDVICDILIGRNISPSVALFKKIVELHSSVRKELYRHIVKKIMINFVNQ